MSLISVQASTTGTQNAVASATQLITLPAYSQGDILVLIVTRNLIDNTEWFGDANATISPITQVASRRLAAYTVSPIASATSFTLSANTTGLWQWACLNVGASANAFTSAANNIGNSTTAIVEIPPVTLGYTTTGEELALAVAATNSTAIWTTDSSTIVSGPGAPGLIISGTHPSAGQTSLTLANANRGNNGASRYETALSLVVSHPSLAQKPQNFFAFFN
jgi:hypothetical protein